METTKKKNGFTGSIGFILASAGSAVGLGNLWAFPYKTSINGGAAFVLIYIICVIVIGLVTMITETYIGHRAQANPVSSFQKINKNWGWLGLFGVLIPLLITCYYSVLGGYTVHFCFNSFGNNAGTLAVFAGNKIEVITCTAIFILLALIVIIGGVQKGIEKASKILMPALFIILVGIMIYCLCLGEGVKEGVSFYIKPDFSQVTFSTVLAAMSQAFFSLSLGMGIMISYGSYTGKNINLAKSAITIAIFDTLVALLAGFAIFSSIYHYQAVYPDANLSTSGLMLMFSSLPLVFEDLGIFGKVISFLFFAMVSIAALTSVISLLEVVTQFAIQKFKINRKLAISVTAVICFLVSILVSISLGYLINGEDRLMIFGQDWLDFLDIMTNTVFMPVCALGSCISLGWFIKPYGSIKDYFNFKKLNAALDEDGLKLGKFGPIYAFMLKYVTPILIGLVEIFGIIDTAWPKGESGRSLNMDGLWIVIVSYILIVLMIAIYFIFFKNKSNGTNEDEVIKRTVKVNREVEGQRELYTYTEVVKCPLIDFDDDYDDFV